MSHTFTTSNTKHILHRKQQKRQQIAAVLHHFKTNAHLTASFPGQHGVSWHQKTILDFNAATDQLNDIQFICIFSRQMTMSTPHHSIFYRPDDIPDAQPTV